MRVLAFWSIVVAIVLALIGVIYALIGFIDGNNIGMGIAGTLVAIVPLAAAIWVWRKSTQTGRPAFEAALAGNFRADDKNWFDASGIAVDKSSRMVILGEANGVRIVPARTITEISYVPMQIAMASGSNPILALLGAIRVASAASHNFSRAGLYVTANGQRTRLIGVKQRDGDKWQGLLAEARAGA